VGRHRRYSLDQELSFSRAARALERTDDPKGRRLRNLVMAREAKLKTPIAIRLAGDQAPKLRITLGAIYRFLPELRRARTDVLADLIRQALAESEVRTAQKVRTEVLQKLEPRIESLEKRATARLCPDGSPCVTKGPERTGTNRPGRNS
jgi:hypothetical protein